MSDGRDEEARENAKQRKAQERRHEKQRVRTEQELIQNHMQGQYFLQRYNMIVDQINEELQLRDGDLEQEGDELRGIRESVDGAKKTLPFIDSEAFMMKKRAKDCFRNRYFAAKKLKDDFGYSEEEVEAVVNEYRDEPIVKDKYERRGMGRGTPSFEQTEE
jgi:hypothetical protein